MSLNLACGFNHEPPSSVISIGPLLQKTGELIKRHTTVSFAHLGSCYFHHPDFLVLDDKRVLAIITY
jgi:hypothetical protein